MDNTTSLFIGAALGFIVGVQLALSMKRRRSDNDNSKLDLIIKNQSKIMANEQQFKDALARIETGTTKAGAAVTAIGERIAGLEDAIKNAGLSKDQEDALLAQTEGLGGNIETLATTLESMGKKVEDPIPDPIPEPVPPVEPTT